MPSPDDTYFPLRRMHALFALSALALLAATVAVLWRDHAREWKVYQRTYRDRVEPWLTAARLADAESADFRRREAELQAALDRAWLQAPPREAVDQLLATARQSDLPAEARTALEAAYAQLAKTPDAARRRAFDERLDALAVTLGQRSDRAARDLRFRRAELDEARNTYERAVGRSASAEELASLQKEVDRLRSSVEAAQQAADAAAAAVSAFAQPRGEIDRAVTEARQALEAHRRGLESLRRTLAQQQPSTAKEVVRLPGLDALARTLAVEQVWLPDLTIDYHFRQVARFDRCTTCHQGMDKVSAEQPHQPAVPHSVVQTLTIPPAVEEEEEDDDGSQAAGTPASVLLGLGLVVGGPLDDAAIAVQTVMPASRAARAGFQPGDLLLPPLTPSPSPGSGRGEQEADLAAVEERLAELLTSEEPVAVEVLRGLPHPYCGHPRPDLYCGPTSPHPIGEFGCTICHDGQGSATDFRWASHTPNTPADGGRWQAEHDWFRNPHWELPMLPARFAQSRCLVCHHEPLELEAGERFPQPPAPKLLAGYRLVRTHGCFGCHEINGYDTAGRRVGPDMRVETLGGDDSPGTLLRKVGPSLREVAPRMSRPMLIDWIRDPTHFQPTARMPQFYGLHGHLGGRALAQAKRFEAVELAAVAEYLTAASEPVPPSPRPPASLPPDAERGRQLFATQGCLACHRHADYAEITASQGPALDHLAAKYATPEGRAWLESWIRDPVRHAPRTLMPRLDLSAAGAAAGAADPPSPSNPAGADPAADIAEYLLAPTDWQPAAAPAFQPADLDDLVRVHLSQQLSAAEAESILAAGVAAVEMDMPADVDRLTAPVTREKKLRYVGLRTLRMRGCAGCHDIPGLEDAQPIGPALTEWGRKREDLLAFGQVHRYIEENGPAGEDPSGFYADAIRGQRREGFLWQKLHAPRSFDYEAAPNKDYTAWLKMGRMRLTDQEAEEVATFVLGLVAQPPAERYVFAPSPRERAIAAGREVLERHACTECHTLAMERWRLEVDPEKLEEPPPLEEHPFLEPQFSPAEVAASMQTDRRGYVSAELVGMPRVDSEGVLIEDFDDDDNPLYFFQLWEPALLGGQVWPVGGAEVAVSAPWIAARQEPWGGAFARWLYPRAVEAAREAGSAATELEAWGWVPPPLVREGAMVRPQWLYDYLLAPRPIRPAAVLRMPAFNLSAAESRTLVDYFLAAAGRESVFSGSLSPSGDGLARQEQPAAGDLDAAMKILTDRQTFCAKCHLIGDYSPGGDVQTILGPNLADVDQRIEPHALRRWLGNPKSVLPYTGMPVNFPPGDAPLGQDLFPADSITQLDAVTRLLLHYSQYWESKTSVNALIQQGGEEDDAP